MTKHINAATLEQWRTDLMAVNEPDQMCISICGGTGCRVYGSEKVWEAFKEELLQIGVQATLSIDIKATGCHGFCEQGPLVVIRPQGILYTHVQVKDVPEIVSETVLAGRIVERLQS